MISVFSGWDASGVCTGAALVAYAWAGASVGQYDLHELKPISSQLRPWEDRLTLTNSSYSHDESARESIGKFATGLLENTVDLDGRVGRLIYEHFWDLV